MKISDQIKAVLLERAAVIKKLETHSLIVVTKTGEGESAVESIRRFTEAEQKTHDDLVAEIAAIDKQIVGLKAMESVLASQAVEVGAGGQPKPTPGLEVKPGFKAFKGQAFTRYVCALARSKGNLMQAELFARGWNDTTPEVGQILKAAVAAGTTTDPTWAAPLVQYNNMVSEFIELLRAETIIDKIKGLRRVPFMTRIPRQTSGSSAGWVGEGLSKPVSKLGFDTVLFPFAKIAVIIVITQELARLSSPAAEVLAKDDMIAAIAAFMDSQFLDSTVAPVTNVHPGSITNGVTPIPATGHTVATVTADISASMLAITNANIPMKSPVWIMSPTLQMFLMTLRTAQDLFAFRDEMSRGTLMGIPFIVSTAVVVTSGLSSLVLLDAAEIMYADDGQAVIDSSAEATLQLDDSPSTPPTTLVSLWQQNMLAIKAERFVYWERRRLPAVQVITGAGATA